MARIAGGQASAAGPAWPLSDRTTLGCSLSVLAFTVDAAVRLQSSWVRTSLCSGAWLPVSGATFPQHDCKAGLMGDNRFSLRRPPAGVGFLAISWATERGVLRLTGTVPTPTQETPRASVAGPEQQPALWETEGEWMSVAPGRAMRGDDGQCRRAPCVWRWHVLNSAMAVAVLLVSILKPPARALSAGESDAL